MAWWWNLLAVLSFCVWSVLLLFLRFNVQFNPVCTFYTQNIVRSICMDSVMHAYHPTRSFWNNKTLGSNAAPLQTRWVEESLTLCSLCDVHHSAASQPSDTEDPLCHHPHAAWSQETLFQKGRLIFSLTIREWLKNRHQTGLIKNRRRLHICMAPLILPRYPHLHYLPFHTHRSSFSLSHDKQGPLNFPSAQTDNRLELHSIIEYLISVVLQLCPHLQ